jgi:hypothetical protein
MKGALTYVWPFAIGTIIFVLSLGTSAPQKWDVLTAIFWSIGLFRVGIRLVDWLIFGWGHWRRMYYDPYLKKWSCKRTDNQAK